MVSSFFAKLDNLLGQRVTCQKLTMIIISIVSTRPRLHSDRRLSKRSGVAQAMRAASQTNGR